MKEFLKALFFVILFSLVSQAQVQKFVLHKFSLSPYFDEQVLTINYSPEVKILINAPSAENFDPNKPVKLILFALPNGNTTEQTIGKVLKPGDDWHYDIQHIGAQTRFLRSHISDYNIVTAYLENVQKSWPAWRSKYTGNGQIINSIVDSLKNIFSAFSPEVVLSSHSGGGSFIFGYMNSVSYIPNMIKRIAFLDSDYNYDDAYGAKLANWINAENDHYLSVLAYNDSVVIYNGSPIVSPTGGTWYRTKLMQKYLAKQFTFTSEEDDEFIKYRALNGRINIILKKNPTGAILHTVQVEKNGFIETSVTGTTHENVDYTYYGDRAYTKWIQNDIPSLPPLNIPDRPSDAIGGAAFMDKVKDMNFDQREAQIFNEISKGNMPEFMRHLQLIKSNFNDTQGKQHTVYYQVMPDYMAIGSDSDFCRIPMGPITAQKLAALFGATLPTSKLVDDIYKNALIKLAPVTYAPVGNENSTVAKFVEHNTAIEQQRISAGGELGDLVGGIKKDVVISNLILDPTRPDHVCIYGWHQLNGIPIQPLTNIHGNFYVDYSHGIRFLNSQIVVDSSLTTIQNILKEQDTYKILSNENGPMIQPSYLADANIPSTPKSFGIKPNSKNQLGIVIKSDTTAKFYLALLSGDGINFKDTVNLQPDNLVLNNLTEDSLYYIKIIAANQLGKSAPSEVLAGIPTNQNSDILIVNGFDRASAGNTFNFVRQHAGAVHECGYYFASATNDAIIDNLFNLNNYKVADYILGDESTADETFSNSEQALVRNFLDNGGNLFVSGSEIAWDLDYKGASSDKNFIWGYLKTKYYSDAPNSQQGAYYQAELLDNTPFSGLSQFNFDNGAHGTIDVKWPDAIVGTNGGIPFIKYSNWDISKGAAGIYFSGNFPNGTSPGKVVCMGIPFETIYPEESRNSLMATVLNFFFNVTGVISRNENKSPLNFQLYQNYPNPFNPSTKIRFVIPSNSNKSELFTTLKIYDMLGNCISTLINEEKQSGEYEVTFDGSSLASGIYVCRLTAGSYNAVRKLTLIK